MTLQLVEGQDFAADYSLLSRAYRRESVENWIALDKQSGERVLLKIFDGAIPEATFERVQEAIAATRGLVHPNIARVYSIDSLEGNDVIATRYVRGATPIEISPNGSEQLERRWPEIEQLLAAVSFAHGLGLAHGHLHPANILVDDQGTLAITDYGLPARLQHDSEHADYLSPQIRSGARPDRSDDIFSLGQIFHVMLTGELWREGQGFQSNRPISTEVKQLILRMLGPTPYDRPKNLGTITEIMSRFIRGESEAPLEPAGQFGRKISTGTAAAASASSGDIHKLPRERRVIGAPLAVAGLGGIVVLAGLLFLLLPEFSPAPSSTPTSLAQNDESIASAAPTERVPAPPALTPLEQARLEQLEERGATVAKEILRLQVELEDIGIQIWDRPAYDEASDLARQADDAYRRDEFEAALTLYEEAKTTLEDTLARVPIVVEENTVLGNEALDAGNVDGAVRAFTILTAINPDDDAAIRNLELAENLETLTDLLDEAAYLESDGKLNDARQVVDSALAIEGQWQPALDAKKRIATQINQRRFQDAMSLALTALADKRFEAARENFERAATILPNSSEPQDGLQQVDIAIKQQRIAELRTLAEQAIQQEDWRAAIEHYETILSEDETLVFAANGLERAIFRAELDESLAAFVDDPTQLVRNDALRQARALVATAAGIEDRGPRLQQQIETVSRAISFARIPVEIEIQSDRRTEVTVYRYGELGRIESRTIELMPGEYTIVGKRDGFRDVQYNLTVMGGRDVPPVFIACTERI